MAYEKEGSRCACYTTEWAPRVAGGEGEQGNQATPAHSRLAALLPHTPPDLTLRPSGVASMAAACPPWPRTH